MSVLLKNVRKTYRTPGGEVVPVLAVDLFELNSGEQAALIGKSGGGKTTITKLLLRFMDIQHGSIEVDGQDISKSPHGFGGNSLTGVVFCRYKPLTPFP